MGDVYAQYAEFVAGLKEEKARALLVKLIQELDELDTEDFFGTEGWRHYLHFEGKVPRND